MIIGIIADTHGVVDPRAVTALAGVEHILHAGDIGTAAIISQLESIAPVTAVHGNIDAGTSLGRRYPAVQRISWEGVPIYMTHVGGSPAQLAAQLPVPPPAVYIFGHSHRPLLATYHGVLFLNPGAAGRPRFGGGLGVALLDLQAGHATARLVPL